MLSGNLSFEIEAQDGFLINSVSLLEFGTFNTFGNGSYAEVQAQMQLVAGGFLLEDGFSFSDFNDGSGSNGGGWNDTFTINFAATDHVTFNLDNTLITSVLGVGGVSRINKNGIQIDVGTVPAIPEPASGMVLVGLCVGFAMRRRSRS